MKQLINKIMILSGKLTFNAVAVKEVIVEKATDSLLIKEESVKESKGDTIDQYLDHPLQGEVVGVGSNVEESKTCKVGDIVLLKISDYGGKPYPLNDKGVIYWVYNETDVLLVRDPNFEVINSAINSLPSKKEVTV